MGINALIELAKPSKTYFAGEIIRGQIVVVNDTTHVQHLTKRIFVLLYGAAATDLLGRTVTNEQSALVTTNRRNSNANEIYLYAKIFLTPEDSSQVELVHGRNGFPFEFELPAHLPSDYMGSCGYIQYRVATTFALRAFASRSFSHNVEFHVINIQDLNLSAIAGRNSYFSFEKFIPIAPARSHDETFRLVNTVVKMSCQGFVPGETIDMTVQLGINQGGLALEDVKVDLIREVSYRCPAGSAIENDGVLDSWNEFRGNNASGREIPVKLKVPLNTIPTSSQQASLIAMQYFITVNIKLESVPGLLAVGKIPITIGSIPLRQLEYNPGGSTRRRASRRGLASPRPQEVLEGAVGGDVYAPSAPLALVDSEDSLDSEEPPSYSEAVAMPVPSPLR